MDAAARQGIVVTVQRTDWAIVFELRRSDRLVSRAELKVEVAELHARTLATLGAVFTFPELRGQGYARTLIRTIVTILPSLGVAQCRLTCRPELRSFYAAMGWKSTGAADEMLLDLSDVRTPDQS